jgi:hypothetical protein
MDTLNSKYPDGFDHATFEFELPGKQTICRAVRLSVDGVNYLIKLESRPKGPTSSLTKIGDWYKL